LVGKPPVLTAAPANTALALWSVVAGCLALAVAIRQSDVVRIVAKGLIDPLFHSTSDGGALFLLGGLAMIAMVLAASAAIGERIRPAASGGKNAWLDHADPGFALLALLAFAHGIGLLALLEYQDALDLPWQLNSYHWSGTDNTFNTLLHSHLGKTALSTVMQSLSGVAGMSTAPGQYDTGAVLIGHVSAGERWSIAVLFLLACTAALAAAPSIARRYAWHPVALALYAYAVMNCLKAVIDGGLLTYRVLPSALMLALLVSARDREHLVALVRRYGLAAALALAAYLAAWAAISDAGWGSATTDFVTLLVLLGLGLLCWAFATQARSGVRRLALAVGAGWLALGYLQAAVTGIGLLLRPLPAEARVVVIDQGSLVARDASDAVRGQTPLAIYRRFGDDPLKPKRVLIERNSQQVASTGREFAFAVRFIDGSARQKYAGKRQDERAGEPSAPAQSSIYSLLGAVRIANRANTAVFLFRTASPDIPAFFVAEPDTLGGNNFHVHLHWIAATLRTQGLEEFVMMPLLRTGDRDLFTPVNRPPA